MRLYRYNKEKMTYDKVLVLPYVLLLSCFFLLLSTSKSSKTVKTEVEPIVLSIDETVDSFSFEIFKQFIVDCGLKFPDIVLAQAIQESNMKSTIWHENHNPFGMKVAKQRNTTALGENRKHAKYKNWRMAVLDYAYMQAVYARKIKTRSDYFKFLEHYAEDPKYTAKLKVHLRRHKGFNLSNNYLFD